jgi:hypothetical protein
MGGYGMTKFFKNLDISIESLVKSTEKIPRLSIGEGALAVACDPRLFLHEHVYNKLSEFGTLVCLVFEMVPNYEKDNIHIDYDKNTNKPFWPALNLILEGQGVLRWYLPSAPGTMRSAGGNIYMAWSKESYGSLIEEWRTGKVALVRTDIPHNAFNIDNVNRLSVSIRWAERHGWIETINWFEQEFLPYMAEKSSQHQTN